MGPLEISGAAASWSVHVRLDAKRQQQQHEAQAGHNQHVEDLWQHTSKRRLKQYTSNLPIIKANHVFSFSVSLLNFNLLFFDIHSVFLFLTNLDITK